MAPDPWTKYEFEPPTADADKKDAIERNLAPIRAYEVSIFSVVANWLFMAGTVVLSGTFRPAHLLKSEGEVSGQRAICDVPLINLACMCYVAWAVSTVWVWRALKHSPALLLDRIFM